MKSWFFAVVVAVLHAISLWKHLELAANDLHTDVCVLGGGSGGIGAALAASRYGASVVLVERMGRLGGTSTNAYVCNWEPGPGDAFAREMYDRLQQMNAVTIVSDHNPDRSKGRFGLWLPTAGARYEDTLRRWGRPRTDWRAIVFDPNALARVALELLEETGKCRVLLNTTYQEAHAEGNRVLSIKARPDDGTEYDIHAKVFIDCTGGVHLCRDIGCETMLGPEPASKFNEPSAPEQPDKTLNAISLCYRIRESENPKQAIEPNPPVETWPRSAHVSGLPNGDRIVNTLALLPGWTVFDMGYEKAMDEAKRRAQAHWRWLQGHDAFSGYEFDSFAPTLGIRESHRVVGEYVLTQHDLLAGLPKQTHRDVIAVADHAMDVHGEGGRRVHGELKAPYGIPYRCLIPMGWTNLLAACRGASFSHIAASSCRLSRTIIALGHAAGLAAATAAKEGITVGAVDVRTLQRELGMPLAAWEQ
ncbi:MAG: FAD-dependent oxidoreductase [Planctomycetota bacterium]